MLKLEYFECAVSECDNVKISGSNCDTHCMQDTPCIISPIRYVVTYIMQLLTFYTFHSQGIGEVITVIPKTVPASQLHLVAVLENHFNNVPLRF